MEVESQSGVSSFDLLEKCPPNGSYSKVPSSGCECDEATIKMSKNDEDDEDESAETAAKKLQKVYRSYRTRRMLADSAFVAEELWWQAIDYARLNHSTISFFDYSKRESPLSRWNRVVQNASKVGKGLSKDEKAQKLAFQHWIEAIDPRHRYGHNLHMYYEEWCKTDAGQPFFFWLDLGDGKEVDLKGCPRSKLRQQCIKYLGPQEREHYEYDVEDGKIVQRQTGNLLDTTKGSPKAKWIFVMSTSKRLYAGEKMKGIFHHSSFLAGGATLAAGRLVVEDGVLKSVSPYSGHYRPTDDSFHGFLMFLEENGVNLDEVKLKKANEDYENYDDGMSKFGGSASNSDIHISDEESLTKNDKRQVPIDKSSLQISLPNGGFEDLFTTESQAVIHYKRTLSGALQSPKPEVSKTAILKRINSKKAAKSYQLGNQLSAKWSTGVGPRIGCVADYPIELRLQAFELTNLSPRRHYQALETLGRTSFLVSPTKSPSADLNNIDVPL
ncbi:hypothetical protein LIER_18038 [Lithospermum erythrorhizon]|uniref:IQ domain-containing protein IQM3-like n=1 Tax=Lithospermum erythrorhizon TaxID=34254 RepID=A0AAV3QCQ3_LITER